MAEKGQPAAVPVVREQFLLTCKAHCRHIKTSCELTGQVAAGPVMSEHLSRPKPQLTRYQNLTQTTRGDKMRWNRLSYTYCCRPAHTHLRLHAYSMSMHTGTYMCQTSLVLMIC